MVGNLITGGIIGLTTEGDKFCHSLAERDVPSNEVPENCQELLNHLHAGNYLANAPAPQTRMRSAYLHVTQRCDLSCRFCYSADDNRNRLADPTLTQLRRAINLLANLGCSRLTISGGEPFLRDDLDKIAGYARTEGINDINILTNGLLLTKNSIAPLASLISCIAIAFDGVSTSAPAHLRGKQYFEQLVKAVKIVRDARIEARILPTLHAQNLDDMPAYKRLADKLGATLSFSLLTADNCTLGDLSLTDRQLDELGKTSVTSSLPGDDSLSRDAAPLSARQSCGAGVRTLSIAADGTVYPCHMLHVPKFAMGNAFLDSSEKIKDSDAARSFQRIGVDNIVDCATCPIRYLCGGGCRARAYLTNSQLASCDPYCTLSRSYYETLGKRLAQRFG